MHPSGAPDWLVGDTRSQSSTSARRDMEAPKLLGSIEMHALEASSNSACLTDGSGLQELELRYDRVV